MAREGPSPDHRREAVHHLEGGDWEHQTPTRRQIGPEHTIQRLVRTSGHDDAGRVHSEALGDLGLEGTCVGVIPDLGEVRRRQTLEQCAGWRNPLVTVELEHPGLRLGRSLVEISGNPGRGER
jgi:hypothetical protein